MDISHKRLKLTLGLVLISTITFCKKEYPVISYLRPQQQYAQGFLDPDNYQWVETGQVFDDEVLSGMDKNFVPFPYPVGFENGSVVSSQDRKNDLKYYSLQEIHETDLMELSDQGVDLSAFDPEILEINSIKKNLMNQACQNAQAKVMVRFLEFLTRDNLFMSKNSNPLAKIQANYLPVPDIYNIHHSQILRNYEDALNQAGFRLEILREELYKPEPFSCRMAVLLRQKDLVLKVPTLQDRS